MAFAPPEDARWAERIVPRFESPLELTVEEAAAFLGQDDLNVVGEEAADCDTVYRYVQRNGERVEEGKVVFHTSMRSPDDVSYGPI